MNNKRLFQLIFGISLCALFSLAGSMAWGAQNGGTRITRNQFFIVSEVNLGQNQIVFEAPSQITATMSVTNNSVLMNEQGKHVSMSDIRAGDTGFLTYSLTGDHAVVISFRLGPMTMEKLQTDYLEGTPPPVPVTAAPTAPAAPQTNGSRGARGLRGARGQNGQNGQRSGSSNGGRFNGAQRGAAGGGGE